MLHGPEDLRVEDVPEPSGDVVVQVEAATTCGTDVKMWRHGHPALAPYPCRFGHETAGIRVDTGERVLVSDSVACGACPPCAAGRSQICRSPTWVLGGFAERIAAPAAALHRIPDGLPAAVSNTPCGGTGQPGPNISTSDFRPGMRRERSWLRLTPLRSRIPSTSAVSASTTSSDAGA